MTRLLARRLDALVVVFRVQISSESEEYLRCRAELAQQHGRAEVELDGELFELKRSRTVNRFYFENADVRCLVDLDAPGARRKTEDPREGEQAAWTVELTARATWLAVTSYEKVLERFRKVAAALGRLQAERLRRFDLAADFDGWKIEARDWHAWVKHGRLSKALFAAGPETETDLTELDDPSEEERPKIYGPSRAPTGFTLGAGGHVQARLYDKTAELALEGNEGKRALEEEIWKRDGWEGDRVTRLEFQFRGEFLDEAELRDPVKLPEWWDAAWQYGTKKWARLVLVGTSTRRKRCKLDPRWEAAQAVVFRHSAAPLRRIRVRGGCGVDQVFGSIISYLAVEGRLGPIAEAARQCAAVETDVASLDGEQAAELTRKLVHRVAKAFYETAIPSLLRNPNATLEKLLVKVRATDARFFTPDG